MKITSAQLKNIIAEEVKKAKARKNLTEARLATGGELYEVSAGELIAFAKAYSSLGAAVTEQLETIIELGADASPDDVNPAAVREVERTLGGVNSEIDLALSEWKAANGIGARNRRR